MSVSSGHTNSRFFWNVIERQGQRYFFINFYLISSQLLKILHGLISNEAEACGFQLGRKLLFLAPSSWIEQLLQSLPALPVLRQQKRGWWRNQSSSLNTEGLRLAQQIVCRHKHLMTGRQNTASAPPPTDKCFSKSLWKGVAISFIFKGFHIDI